MEELARKMADAKARSELDPEKLSQGKADLKPVQAEAHNAGPPFFNLTYCEKVLERLPGDEDTFIKRFVAEVFKTFDSDKDGALSLEDVSELAKSMFAALQVQPLAARNITDVCLLAEPDQTEADGFKISEKGFKIMYAELYKKAKFKMKQGGFVPGTASNAGGYNDGKGSSKGAGKGALETPQECTEFPKGTKVEVINLKYLLATYAEGAKKMRLTKFTSDQTRKPKSKVNLEVVGSFQYKGASRDGLTTGMMVIGIRNPDDDEEYLIGVEGLKPYQQSEEEKARRAKLAAEGLLDCTQVSDVSAQIQKQGVRLPDGTFMTGSEKVEGAEDQPAEASAPKRVEAKKDNQWIEKDQSLEHQRRSKMADDARKGTLRTPGKKPTRASGVSLGADVAGATGAQDEDGIWLDEGYWLEAKFECSEADGCMDINIGDWIWIQFEGTGESKGWLYGTDANGTISGWIPGDIGGEGSEVKKCHTEGPAIKT